MFRKLDHPQSFSTRIAAIRHELDHRGYLLRHRDSAGGKEPPKPFSPFMLAAILAIIMIAAISLFQLLAAAIG